MVPCSQLINGSRSSYSGNRQTRTTTVTLAHALRGLINVCICGDFKQTVNPVSALDKYPIPKVEDLFSTLAGDKIFSKINLSQA